MEPHRHERPRRTGRERVYIAPSRSHGTSPQRFTTTHDLSRANQSRPADRETSFGRKADRLPFTIGSRGRALPRELRSGSGGGGSRFFSTVKRPRPHGGRGGALHYGGMRSHERSKEARDRGAIKKTAPIPPLKDDSIRVICLVGVEEIGRNMTLIEFRNDIVVIVMGLQFNDAKTPGIDFILPNTKYLEERKDKIRAVLITHGHLDHIGGIPYLMNRIGNPPMYTRNLTALMIRKRQEEFPHLPPIDMKIVEGNNRVKFGDLSVRFFGVTHSIPDSMGIIVETPYGNIVTPGDYKLDHVDGVPTEEEETI